MVVDLDNLEFMQDTLFSVPVTAPAIETIQNNPFEDMSLIFNTAFVRNRAPARARDLSAELAQVSNTPAARAILAAAQQLATSQGLSEMEAAEQIIQTFKKLDEIWGAYLYQEGLARLNSDSN
jgi:hypothetical protein